MKNSFKVLLLSFAVVLVNCSSRTLVGGRATPSPSGKYSLIVWGLGAPGKAYNELSQKGLEIKIKRTDKEGRFVFDKTYPIKAANMRWEVEWLSDTELKIEVSHQTGNPKESISTIHLREDITKNCIVEVLPPAR